MTRRRQKLNESSAEESENSPVIKRTCTRRTRRSRQIVPSQEPQRIQTENESSSEEENEKILKVAKSKSKKPLSTSNREFYYKDVSSVGIEYSFY